MDYYEKMSLDDFFDYRIGVYLHTFSDYEVDCLGKFGSVDVRHNLENSRGFYRSLHIYNKRIYKFSDEWYVVQFDDFIYKCDQFEGLLKCLDDI